jgi:hypothetical protein
MWYTTVGSGPMYVVVKQLIITVKVNKNVSF